MRIRTYLAISYLLIILGITLGMMVVVELTLGTIAKSNLAAAESAIRAMSDEDYRFARKILTAYGQKVVEAKAEEVAREVALVLGGRDSYDYGESRRDDKLRRIAVQDIVASGRTAGYTTLGDRKGVAVLHPNRAVEGKNFKEWSARYPGLWDLVKRSFTEKRVQGYYTFFERDSKQPGKKFMVLVQVPRTPFTVASTVYIDHYFVPAQEAARTAADKAVGGAKQSIEHSSRTSLNRVRFLGAGAALALLLGAIGFGLWFAAFISRPVMALQDGVKQIGKGDFTVEVPERGAREVRDLAQAFNRLGRQLTEFMEKRDFIRDTFGRYLTQEVVNRLLESKDGLRLGGETREISIMMSDLRGFTALSSTLAPEQVIAFLNRYVGKMVEILMDHRGVIDEIIGDGILAFFGAPEPLEDHPARAVACALTMQAAMAEVNAGNEAEGLPRLEMGIAVNTGSVVVGNIGSEKRAKYGAVGSEVNFTGRVESFTVGGQVLISETTFRKLGTAIILGNILEVEMKGVPGKVKLYEVKGITGPYEVHLPTKEDMPVQLKERINVQVLRMDKKIMTGTGVPGWITHLGRSSAIMIVQQEIARWEDVRLQLVNDRLEPAAGEIYAKVVSVSAADEDFKVTLQFTSVSSEARKAIAQATGAR